MIKRIFQKLTVLLMLCVIIFNCKSLAESPIHRKLTIIASSEHQWTGIAVSKKNRIFVNFPTWSDNVPIKIAEIIEGKAHPYPDITANKNVFNAIQSVFIDKKNRLWILDTNNPNFKGIKNTGPKLYQCDLSTNKIVRMYNFKSNVYEKNSYFNDVRIDEDANHAYITDSGNGAIIVLNLKNGISRRLLAKNKAVKSEVNYLICNGIKWQNSVDSDGIALSPDRQYLYFIALTSHTLYRIKTILLKNENIAADKLSKAVEKVATVPATDGMIFDKKGNLYLGGLEDNSINIFTNKNKLIKLTPTSTLIRWADSFALDMKGNLLFTTSQIYLPKDKRKKYQIISISFNGD